MKKFFLLTIMIIACWANSFAQSWTDENGVTWYFSVESENAATITGAADYGEILTVPDLVYDGEIGFSVVSIGQEAFYGVRTIKRVILPASCTSIGEMAFQGSALTRVDMSSCASIGMNAFYACSSLARVDLSSCTSIGSSAFSKCRALTSVGNLSSCTSIGSSAFYNCRALTSVDLSSCTSIGSSAFYGCSALTSVGNLSSCTSIGSSAFSACSSLTSVGDLSSCTSLGPSAFSGCSKLTSITIPKNLTEIGENPFSNCSGLTSIVVEEGNPVYDSRNNCNAIIETATNKLITGCVSTIIPKEVRTIGGYAFSGFTSLTSVDLSSCTNIGDNAFQNCSSLKSVGDLSSCTNIGASAFQNCSSLKSVGDLSSCTKINSYAFSDCCALSTVGDLSSCTTVVSYAFQNCTSLTNVNLYSCTGIGASAFSGCISLSDIGNLSACKTISNEAFSVCTSLTYVYISTSAPPQLKTSVFESNVIFKVPEHILETYKSAPVWSDMASRIFSINEKTDYDITTTAEADNSGLLRSIAVDDLQKVVQLKVTGSINSNDIIVMNNKMTNLHRLDLTDADIVACDKEYYTGYKTADNILGDYMFYDKDKYISIKLPKSIKSIETHAFHNCDFLNQVGFQDGLTEIANNAFNSCGNLIVVNLPSTLCKIGSYAFGNCPNLRIVTFPDNLEIIDDYAFSGCSTLANITLPKRLKTIGSDAFYRCYNLTEIKIPSSVTSIGGSAFFGCDLKKIYTATLLPISIDQTTFSTYETATLYVPKTSYSTYWLNTEWSQFVDLQEFDWQDDYFYVDKDYIVDDNTGTVGGKPDGDLNPGSGFIQNGSEDQELGDVHIKDDGNSVGSIIGNGNITADNLFFDMTIKAGKWYFFCFPFKVMLADITCPGQYVWRKYDGAKRAENGEGGWVDLDADEDHLKKGYGYIFQASKDGTLTLKVTKNNFGKFDNADHHHAVEQYPADDANNASWNFMGNPHTSYYGIGEMGYDAPITIWTGTTYEAVRPGDDDYYLKPFQAFFVQKPEGQDEVEFKADSRTTYTEAQQTISEAKMRRLARGVNKDRLLINLTISDGENSDKTRVVFNDKKSVNYELGCDADKFMSTEAVPQIYTTDNNDVRYAINERPNGDVYVGYSASKAGDYSISATRMDKPMLLKDLLMDITFDLASGEYTFNSEAGEFDKRFMLVAAPDATGIADIQAKTGVSIMATEGGISISGAAGKQVAIHSVGGAKVAAQVADGIVAVQSGAYIVTVEGMSTKVLVQ